jgi:hypothetical protein
VRVSEQYLQKYGESVELLATPDWTTKKADKGKAEQCKLLFLPLL